MRVNLMFLMVLLLCACMAPDFARADLITFVSMNTAPLVGHAAGPFSLEFQLNDGEGIGDGNNTVTLSGFSFGLGGAPFGSPSLLGGASGDLSSAVQITDSSFFNQFIQGFTPGSLLQFHMSLTTNVDSGGVPDLFSFAILDSTGTELPTQASFFDVFMQIDIDSANPSILTFASDPNRSPAGGEPPLNIAAPEVTNTVVPEPGSLTLLATALLVLGWLKARKRA